MSKTANIKIGFFGGPEYSVMTLDTLVDAGYVISFVVTSPDQPKGRNLILTAPPAKVWATKRNIPVFQFESLRDPSVKEQLARFDCDVFVVMAYGKIIPPAALCRQGKICYKQKRRNMCAPVFFTKKEKFLENTTREKTKPTRILFLKLMMNSGPRQKKSIFDTGNRSQSS